MDKGQLATYAVNKMLKQIPRGFSAEAHLAVMMIIAHESYKGRYIKQVGNGPALGLIQMEPATHQCVWDEGDSVWENALFVGIITKEQFDRRIHPQASRLLYDLHYNVFMARQRLFMKPEALPKSKKALGKYLKKHWNSVQGAAAAEDYVEAYDSWS